MKLLDLHMDGFGKFHSRDFTFEDGLNIVYGKNEAGKSTLHTFIRGMFFGIERQRGRASKNDLYLKYEPWENSGTYEGKMRLEYNGRIYRIERNFQKSNKSFTVIDETAGQKLEAPKAFMSDLLCGLSETTYTNTISIGQLKSATDEGMVTELKNYIANLNTSGNMALNITKASAYLKGQRRELESQMAPEAARSYTALLSEIRNVEKEISSPEYENQIHSYRSLKSNLSDLIDQKLKDRETLLQKVARGRQVLSSNQFTDQLSITAYQTQAQDVYQDYLFSKAACEKKSKKVLSTLFLITATLLLCGAGFLYYLGPANYFTAVCGIEVLALCAGAGIAALIFYFAGILVFLRLRHEQKDMAMSAKILQEMFSRYLGSSDISPEAVNAFQEQMAEFSRLSAAVAKSEASLEAQAAEISDLQQKQASCGDVIEKQQRVQWELEKKLERLADCKNQAEALRHVLAENDRIREELAAIDLASEVMTNLSSSIRDSFGLYLNKTASDLISGITGGIYTSMSVDENLNVFLNTKTRLVPLEQVSSGAMDQVYLALRLAAASLIQDGRDQMPLIFDDSFALYDDDRLRTALLWLAKSYPGQVIIFTCHRREAQMMTANQIPYHLVEI